MELQSFFFNISTYNKLLLTVELLFKYSSSTSGLPFLGTSLVPLNFLNTSSWYISLGRNFKWYLIFLWTLFLSYLLMFSCLLPPRWAGGWADENSRYGEITEKIKLKSFFFNISTYYKLIPTFALLFISSSSTSEPPPTDTFSTNKSFTLLSLKSYNFSLSTTVIYAEQRRQRVWRVEEANEVMTVGRTNLYPSYRTLRSEAIESSGTVRVSYVSENWNCKVSM